MLPCTKVSWVVDLKRGGLAGEMVISLVKSDLNNPALGQGYEVTSAVVAVGAGGVWGFWRTVLMHLEPQVAFEIEIYSVF